MGNYGNVNIEPAALAHLGDVNNSVHILGQIHLHYNTLKRNVGASTKSLDQASPESLRDLRQALLSFKETLCHEDVDVQTPQVRATVAVLGQIDRLIESFPTNARLKQQRPRPVKRKVTYHKKRLQSKNGSISGSRIGSPSAVGSKLDVIELLLHELLLLHISESKAEDKSVQEKEKVMKVQLVLLLPQLSFSSSDLKHMFISLQDEVSLITAFLRFVLTIAVARLATLLPQIWILHRTLRILPQMLRTNDCFKFCDARNVTTYLPIADFCYWEVFKARLDCVYRDTPGHLTIADNCFILTNSADPLAALDASNWQLLVSTGIRVDMFINVMEDMHIKNTCPNALCKTKISKTMTKVVERPCSQCGCTSISSRAEVEKTTDDLQVSKTHAYSRPASFLDSNDNRDRCITADDAFDLTRWDLFRRYNIVSRNLFLDRIRSTLHVKDALRIKSLMFKYANEQQEAETRLHRKRPARAPRHTLGRRVDLSNTIHRGALSETCPTARIRFNGSFKPSRFTSYSQTYSTIRSNSHQSIDQLQVNSAASAISRALDIASRRLRPAERTAESVRFRKY